MSIGTHLIVDYYEVEDGYLETMKPLKVIFDEVLAHTKLEVVNSFFYDFDPMGASGIYLLKTSHLSFHSFPEKHILSLDIYTCGDREELYTCIETIRRLLPYGRMTEWEIRRGLDE